MADKRKSTNLPKTVVIENEEYEIKSFPDGTQVKVKTSDHKTNNKMMKPNPKKNKRKKRSKEKKKKSKIPNHNNLVSN